MFCVIKEDGTYAGIACDSYEEARELSAQHENSQIFSLLNHADGVVISNLIESALERYESSAGEIDDACKGPDSPVILQRICCNLINH